MDPEIKAFAIFMVVNTIQLLLVYWVVRPAIDLVLYRIRMGMWTPESPFDHQAFEAERREITKNTWRR